MPTPRPLALPPALPSELLSYVLTHQVYPTTVLICQPRTTFLSSLIASVPQPVQRQPPYTPAADIPTPNLTSNDTIADVIPPETPQYPLLIPTLHQIATSRKINLVFIPTVSHLRAYLSAFPPPKEKDDVAERAPKQIFDKPGKQQTPLLIVYGLAELHRDSSEWSAQGIGNSASVLVEAALRSGRRIVAIEERKEDDGDHIEIYDEDRREETRSRRKVWEDRVPMLNGSVKRAGFESEDSAWGGRTIEVGRIFARWFRFGKGDWELDD